MPSSSLEQEVGSRRAGFISSDPHRNKCTQRATSEATCRNSYMHVRTRSRSPRPRRRRPPHPLRLLHNKVLIQPSTMNGHLRESSSASDTCGADRPSSMKQLFTSRWPNKDGSAAPSSSQTESHAATEEKTERRRPSMEKEESLRLADVNTCCAESSTSVLTTDDQAGELTLKLRPQALGDNTLHNSSSLFSEKWLDAIQRREEEGELAGAMWTRSQGNEHARRKIVGRTKGAC